VKQAGVRNYLVVAIDSQLRDYLVKEGFNVYFKDVKVSRPCGLSRRMPSMHKT
jgi:predicted acetyltransferase